MKISLKASSSRATLARQDGFTLVELLVVLAIIGLIAAIATPQVMRYLGTAKVDTTKAQMKNIESALELYYIDAGKYPSEEQGLTALEIKPETDGNWNGPYMKKGGTLQDGWGKPYLYKSPAGEKPFEIVSYGRDGKEGGEGQDADITSE